MSIEQAIHQRWKTCRPLTDVVASDRFYTRTVPADVSRYELEQQPYVILERRKNRQETRLSDGKRLAATILRFHVWSQTFEEAKQVAREIYACFDRQEFSFGEILVQDMKRTDQRETQQPDNVWHLSLDYLARIETQE